MDKPILDISRADRLAMTEALAKYFRGNKEYMESPVSFSWSAQTNAHVLAFETYWAQQPNEYILENFARLPKEDIEKSRAGKALQDFVLTNRRAA